MNRASSLPAIVLLPLLAVAAAAAPSTAPPPPDDGDAPLSRADRQKNASTFNVFQQRVVQSAGLPAAAAVNAVVPPPPAGAVPPPSWADEERARALAFDDQFGPRAYENLKDFTARCKPGTGCDYTVTGPLYTGADEFVGLQRDVENKILLPESPGYRSRHQEIKSTLRGAMDQFYAKPGGNPRYDAELISVSDPILKKVFTPDELIQFAQRNAASSDSPAYYTYLGQKLNGAGAHGPAREAFSAALERNPNDEKALSGRAEAKYELGDFPGAVSDASAALNLDPGDARALTALKFSEGRIGGAAAAGGARSGAAAGTAALGAGSSGADEDFARAVAGVSPDAARRSDALVEDAKRSLSMGDALSAAESLRKAVDVNPGNAQAYALASMAYSRLQNYSAAFSAAESGLKLAPRSAALLDSEAFALNHLKDYRGALAAADRAIAVNPRDAVAYFNRAAALAGLGDRAGMRAALETAASLDPKFEAALEAIRKAPEASDIMYLFPGAAPAEALAEKPADAARPWPVPSRDTLLGGGFALLALLLSGLLLRRRRAPAAKPPSLRATVRRAPSVLAGKYEVGRQIGSGGMGVVYEGRDLSLSRAVAIKRMREEIRWDPKERDRFVAEAKLVAKLRHPHIVEIRAIAEHDGEIYLVFEYVAGKTLHEVLAAQKRLPFARARHLFRGVVSAVDYASERGVVHRDLKPANIMVDPEGLARVMDFGIARLTEDVLSRHSRTRATVVGTPLYMAPEQELGKSRKESDVFSLGVCLYESLTGERPYGGMGAGLLMNKMNRAYAAASAAAPGLPPGIDAVFAKALEPEPDKRYASAGELLRALESLEASPAA